MALNPADTAFIDTLRHDLPPEAFRPITPNYLEEPRGAFAGHAGAIVAPDSTDQIARVIARAHAARVPVLPYGGGTGLVGGQIAPKGQIPAPLVLSTQRLTAIRGVYPTENVIIAEAGAILANVQAAATQAGALFPLSLASEGSARIGGLLATNAGGVNVLRYGNARDLCLGLEAVLPDGSVWHGLKRLRKDNTGYDLRNLLIGSEGSLGVITAASLRLSPIPQDQAAALFVTPSPQAALRVLKLAQSHVAEGISAFELISGQGLRFVADTMPDIRQPLDPIPDWAILVDLGLSSGATDALEQIFADAHAAGDLLDGTIAQSHSQRQDFWTLRESIPEANRKIGAISSHDISLPLGSIPDFIRAASDRLAQIGTYRINCFGHLGDGNLHYNTYPLPGQTKADRIAEKPMIQEAIHRLVTEMDGSISAEHGIGRLKAQDLERFGDPVKLAAMRAIKAALDPRGIMNPGAVLRPLALD